jgi:hypothetical protein
MKEVKNELIFWRGLREQRWGCALRFTFFLYLDFFARRLAVGLPGFRLPFEHIIFFDSQSASGVEELSSALM